MKITNQFRCVICAFVLSLGLVSCDMLDMYSIDAPADLQNRIDSIAASKPNTGDTTYVTIGTALVGNEDNSSGWWTAFSDYFNVPANKLLHLEFINHSSGVNNWNNWNLAVANAQRGADGYKEYFVLRSDAYGWGDSNYNSALLTQDYPDTDGDGSVWNDFKTTMQGARVTMEIDHSVTGYAFITVKAVGTNGTTLTETYQHPVDLLTDAVAFLVCDGSYLEMKKAYLIPSKITAVADQNPVSIVVNGAPSFVELGNTDYWGAATATVTFADGSTKQVAKTDLIFTVVPDMATLGKKTVVATYSKSKQGNYCPAVSAIYNLEVTNSVASLEVTTMPVISKYYYFSSDSILFNTKGIVVTATYTDGTSAVMPNESLTFGKINADAGTQHPVITYKGATKTVTTTCPVILVKGIAQVGATDFSTGWWTVFSDDYSVASGATKTITLYCYSDNKANWHSPCTILRKADKTENAVVRMDSFGWGGGYGTATLTSDWDWTTFTSNISGSKVVIKVTNNGNNTADILYTVTYATGETHFQKYAGITVDSSDLTCALVTESSYFVIVQ